LQMGWIAGHLLEDGFLMNAGRLGAAADQRIDGADYHVVRDDDRVRHLVDDNLAQASADHLFHESGWREHRAARTPSPWHGREGIVKNPRLSLSRNRAQACYIG